MRVDRELQKKYEAAAVQCSEYTAVGGCGGLADALWVQRLEICHQFGHFL